MAKKQLEMFGPDTISKFEKSAQMRIAEGDLLAKDHPLTAIYLYGYAAEMTLKAAYFRNLGFGAVDEIDPNERNRAMARARASDLMGFDPHDIPGWARLLVRDKGTIHLPAYHSRLEKKIVANAISIYENWRPEMRYRHTTPARPTVIRVRDLAQWIVEEYPFQ
jgi:hypothetical protein